MKERDQILDSIRNQVLAKRTETDQTLALLEQMRGAQTDVNYSDLLKSAKESYISALQNTFNNELANAQFQAGYSTDQANYALNQFTANKNAELASAEQALFQSTHPHGVRLGIGVIIFISFYRFNPRTRTGCDQQRSALWSDKI